MEPIFRPIKNEELKWISLDFDGVLAELSQAPHYPMMGPQPGVKELVEFIYQIGLKPKIYTARASADYVNLERWTEHFKIPMRRITTGKDLDRWFLDDKAIEIDPSRPELSFERARKIIETGKYPW